MTDPDRERELAELRAIHALRPPSGAIPAPPPPPPLPSLPPLPPAPPTDELVLPISSETTLPDLRRELELQRGHLQRERAEVERLREELRALQGGGTTRARRPSERGAVRSASDRTRPPRRGKPGESQGGATPRGVSPLLIAAGLGCAALAFGGAVWLAIGRGGSQAAQGDVTLVGPQPAPEAPPRPLVPRPAPAPPPSNPLREKLHDLELALAALPSEPTARRTALERVEAGLRSLRRSEDADALAGDFARLQSRVDEALAGLPGARPSPRPAPRPTPATPPAPAPPRPRATAPTPAPEPRPAPPRPAPSQPPARPAAPSRELTALFDEALGHYDARDAARLGSAVTALERLSNDAPETRAARGLFLELSARYRDAARELEQVGEVGGARTARALVRSLFTTMRYEAARALLPRLPEGEGARWQKLIDGPIRATYPLAADACAAVTADGHYRVITDLGLEPDWLPRLERKLDGLPEAERTKQLEKARKAHKGLSELCDVMEKAYKAYGKLLRTEEEPQVHPTVYVFESQAGFDRFSTDLAGDLENVLGYYLPSHRVLVFYNQPEGKTKGRQLSQGTLNVLLHETFHQWLHLHVEDRPRWFDEGMAEYFGISEMTASGLRYGLVPALHPSRLDNIRDALGGSLTAPMSLEEMIRAPRSTFYGANRAVNYAQAWSFVHYLGSSSKGQKLLRDYFLALQRGLDQEGAFREVFPRVSAMEEDWRDYVRKLR